MVHASSVEFCGKHARFPYLSIHQILFSFLEAIVHGHLKTLVVDYELTGRLDYQSKEAF